MDIAKLLEKCEQWHNEDKHDEIIAALEAIDASARSAELDCILARAYNNEAQRKKQGQVGMFLRAVQLLEAHEDELGNTALWNYRLGYAYFYLREEKKALPLFEKAARLDPSDSTYSEFVAMCQRWLVMEASSSDAASKNAAEDTSSQGTNREMVKRIKKELQRLSRNSIVLDIQRSFKDYEPCSSHFGGKPDVPHDFVWPRYQCHDFGDEFKERPLTFLAQFNLTDYAQFDDEHLLPDHGLLQFFFETDSQPWGFDPDHRGCFKVYYYEDFESLHRADFPEDMEDLFKFPPLHMAVHQEKSYPCLAEFYKLFEDDFDSDDFYQAYEELVPDEPENRSKLLGWANLIQGCTIYAKAEGCTRGLKLGDPHDYQQLPTDIKAKVADAINNWMLLFQLDVIETPEFDFMFGDCGRLYFCINKEDLAARNFNNVWFEIQCY